jgi:LPS sulfotransferase NodH
MHSIISKLVTKIKEITNIIFGMIGHKKFTPFIVLSRSRTGSNLLISFLNSNNKILAESEIFRNIKDKKPEKILKKVFAKQPFWIKAKGFKLFYYHPIDGDPEDLKNKLLKIKNLHVIHLKRKNILSTLVSRKIAENTNVWADRGNISNAQRNSISDSQVHFYMNELDQAFEETERWQNKSDEIFFNHPKIEIFYEDLINHPDETFLLVTSFLNVPYASPKTKLKKQNLNDLSKQVENYSELKKHFSNTKWAVFFE